MMNDSSEWSLSSEDITLLCAALDNFSEQVSELLERGRTFLL